MSNTETKAPFHLLITNNETGETIRELDMDAIIGAVHLSAAHCGGIVIANCPTIATAETMLACEATLKKAEAEDPMVGLMKKMIEEIQISEEEAQED